SNAIASDSVSAWPTISMFGISASASDSRARMIAESSTIATRSFGSFTSPRGGTYARTDWATDKFMWVARPRGVSRLWACSPTTISGFPCGECRCLSDIAMPASARRCQRRSIDQSVLDGVVGKVGIRLHAHLLQHAAAVGADRLDRQVKLVGDLRYRRARGELAEDLELALRQLAMERLVGTAGDAISEDLSKR